MAASMKRTTADRLPAFVIWAILLAAGAGAQSGEDGHFRRGRELFSQRKPAEAAVEFERTLQRNPRQPGAAKLLGLCYHLIEEHDKAEKAFRLAVRQDPKDFDSHFFLGRLLYHRNFFEQSRAELETAIGLNPRDPRGHNYLALTFEAMGDNEKALAEHETAVKWNERLPKPDFRPSAGYGALLLKLGRFPESKQQLLRAKQLNPLSWETLFDLGKLYHVLGDLDSARRELEGALAAGTAGPEALPRIRYLLARIYYALGRSEDASTLLGTGGPKS